MKSSAHRILVAEDSRTQAEHLRLLLEEQGYRVEAATNGLEGLERVRRAAPDLIISDVVMPGMDGYAFCQAVKSLRGAQKIPFILFTERHGPADIIEGFLRGADNFIPKSSPDDYLLERVRRIFEQLEHRRKGQLSVDILVRVGEREISVSADKQQMFELLIATLEETGRVNEQLRDAQRLLQQYAQGLEARVKERTRELREAQQRLQHVVSSSPSVLYTLRIEGREFVPAWVSENIERFSGYTPVDVAGAGWWADRVHPDDRESVLAQVPTLLSEGYVAREYRFRQKDGTYRWVRDEQVLIREAAAPPEVVGSWSDVTERKRLEAQLFQSQKMESVGRLAGGVAHDFNNLLGVITGYGDLLQRDIGPRHPAFARVAEIRKAADRAAALTRQLLAFSRKQVLEPKVLDLNAVVSDIEKMLRRLIGEDIQLVTVAGRDLGRVKADPGQMEQVIVNLVVNARDAMPQGGKLIVETGNVILDEAYARSRADARPGPHVMLAISDTGHGMNADTLTHIFEPFFTTKEQGRGTGLGLATVYGIVRQSAGHVMVYSEPGQGTTFKVYLPRFVETAEAPAVARATAAEAPPSGTETVLLVEDEASLRVMIREILESAGYRVLDEPA
jgi:PAS domain S-box-containing protein